MRSFSLLRNLDLLDLGIYTTIFLVLFTIGFMGGKFIGKMKFFQELTKRTYFEGTPKMIKNGQHNLLVIEVDRLTTQEARLNSVWLLISLPESNSLTFIPLYPRIESGSIVVDSSLTQAFALTPEGYLSSAFLEQLSKQIWWDNYLLIDEISITKILETLNNEGNKDMKFNILTAYNAIPPVWLEPDKALQEQVELLKETCTLIGKLPGFQNIDSILQQADSHIRTDLYKNSKAEQDIFDQTGIYPLACEFPTLTFNNQ